MQRTGCNGRHSPSRLGVHEPNGAFSTSSSDSSTFSSSVNSSGGIHGKNCLCSDSGLDVSQSCDGFAQASSTMINPSRSSPFDSLTQPQMMLMDYALIEICKTCKLSDGESSTKVNIVDSLCVALMQNQLWYNYENQGLFIIGSTINGFGLEKGDLDVCLMMTPASVTRGCALKVLQGVENILKQTVRWQKCDVIRAIVPILSIFDGNTGISINLNINNSVGIRNSHLMRCYTNFDWRVQPLVIFVKKWAKLQQINSAKNRTICSYALTLMVLNYLQCGLGNKPILPALQNEYPKVFADDIQSLTSHVVIPPFAALLRNTMSLSELLLGFFELYGVHFRYDRSVISVRLGRLLSIDEVRSSQLPSDGDAGDNQVPNNSYGNAQLFVEEPFNYTNVARSTYDQNVFNGIKEVFHKSYELLKKTKDPYSILSARFSTNGIHT